MSDLPVRGPARGHSSPLAPGERAAVLIVGGGPVGLTAANLLGAMGVTALVVERNRTTSDDAKAISLDDESLRTLQLAGLDDPVRSVIVPGTGTKYFGVGGRPLVHARGTGEQRFGHPFKNPFAQPDLERVLLAELARFPNVTVRFGSRLVGIRQHREHVRAVLDSGSEGDRREEIDASYLLGCDGGRSTVREILGIPMRGRSYPDDVWLVVDTLDDPHDERYGLHIGDPVRPAVIVPGREGRCRYEFRLWPGECVPGEAVPFELVRRLVSQHRDIAPNQVERAIAYTFHALLAERLRDGRCFLLGDAAHMMPPFAGQGLNSGIRDAGNLTWKVAEVLSGRAGDALLDTYDIERRPHARAVIDLSVRLGRIVLTTERRRARIRDLCVRAALGVPAGRRYMTEMRFRPDPRLREGAVVQIGGLAHRMTGTLLHQPQVLHGPQHAVVRLDDVLGTGWSLLGTDQSDGDWDAATTCGLPSGARVDIVLRDRSPRSRGGRTAVADADGQLQSYFSALTGYFVLVRPDRIIAAVFTQDRAGQVADALRGHGLPQRAASRGPSDISPEAPEGVR